MKIIRFDKPHHPQSPTITVILTPPENQRGSDGSDSIGISINLS